MFAWWLLGGFMVMLFFVAGGSPLMRTIFWFVGMTIMWIAARCGK